MYSNVNRIFHFLYFNPDYPTSGSTVTGLVMVYCNQNKPQKRTYHGCCWRHRIICHKDAYSRYGVPSQWHMQPTQNEQCLIICLHFRFMCADSTQRVDIGWSTSHHKCHHLLHTCHGWLLQSAPVCSIHQEGGRHCDPSGTVHSLQLLIFLKTLLRYSTRKNCQYMCHKGRASHSQQMLNRFFTIGKGTI
jgi:hypothetical protein